MAEEAKKTYADMRQKISALAKKINELDAERSEYEYVPCPDPRRACPPRRPPFLPPRPRLVLIWRGHPLLCSVAPLSLVVRTLEGMDGARACYRMTGGVLVERTVKEVMPAVAKNLEGVRVLDTCACCSPQAISTLRIRTP